MLRKCASKLGFVALVLLLAAGLGVWIDRVSLLAWVQVRGLANAGDSDRLRWVERVANLGDAAVAPLLGLLKREEEQPCRNARAALAALVDQWGYDDPRTTELVGQVAREFGEFSDAGSTNALRLALDWFSGPKAHAVPARLRAALNGLLTAAADKPEPVRLDALQLCAVLIGKPSPDEVLLPARALVSGCLQAESPHVRARAVQLAAIERLGLLEQVVPLLQDQDAEVRRSAILAVGLAVRVVRDESLLSCLHDADAEVRRLCEVALAARGLRPEHLQLGRLLTDASPNVRLQVLDHLFQADDLDPGLWLRRLSHDPSPSVRAGAVRVMGQLTQLDLGDRIEQMGRDDPSPTVAALARYYLKHSSGEAATGAR